MTEAFHEDPYRPPQAAETAPAATGPDGRRGPLPWSPTEAYAFAWGWVRREPLVVLVMFVAYIVGSVPGIAGSVVQNVLMLSGESDLVVVGWIVYATGMLVGIPLNIWMMAGAARYTLALARGRSPEFAELFGTRGFGSAFGAYLLLMLVFVLAGAVLLGPAVVLDLGLVGALEDSAAAVAATALGLLLFAVFAIVLAAKWAFWAQAAVDHANGAVQALSESWRITRGQFWGIVLFWIVTVLVVIAAAIAGVLALCVGLIVTLPAAYALMNIAIAYVFLKLSGTEPVAAA